MSLPKPEQPWSHEMEQTLVPSSYATLQVAFSFAVERLISQFPPHTRAKTKRQSTTNRSKKSNTIYLSMISLELEKLFLISNRDSSQDARKR